MNDGDPILADDFRNYAALLRQYHRLLTIDRDDTAEAEPLREQMHLLWDRLDDRQKVIAAGLGSDLNWARRGLAPRARPKEEVAQADLKALVDAKLSRDPHALLGQLRRCVAAIEPPVVAYLRGSAWMELRDLATAFLFFQKAAELDPANPNYRFLSLQCQAVVDPSAAIAQSREILADHEQRFPSEVVKAADIRLGRAQEMPDHEARPIWQSLAEILDRTMTRLQLAGTDEKQPSVFAMAAALSGFCYEHLGDLDAARTRFDEGLAVAPNHDGLLVARGILRYERETDQAVADFRRAVELNCPVVWPLFCLAHSHLLANQYGECLRLCAVALRYPGSAEVKANLIEWAAICQSELGFPTDAVRATFAAARELAPGNRRIADNQQAFETVQAAAAVQEAPWILSEKNEVRRIAEAEYAPTFPLAAAA